MFKSKRNWVFIVLAIAIIVTGSFTALLLRSNQNDTSGVQSNPEIVTKSTDDPSEKPITDDNYEWKGKATEPKKIILTTINVEGYIQKVDIDQRKEVGVPSNINLAGWFMRSSIPAQKGLSIIDGHVDGKSKPGIFKKLDKLKVGSTFEIQFGNGTKKKFKVTSTTSVAKEKAPALLFSQDPEVESQLNLITCGGTFDRKARRYNDRIIVTSVPID